MHSGADLQSAAAVVLGLKLPAVKNKPVRVEPVPALAQGPLKQLVQDALAAAQLQPVRTTDFVSQLISWVSHLLQEVAQRYPVSTLLRDLSCATAADLADAYAVAGKLM